LIVLGHRGGRGEGWVPENTLPAFARALAEGANGVELDVRLCASGEIVVMHDRTLARVTGGRDSRGVHEVALRDLPRLEDGAKIPTLDETLDMFSADHLVNIEVKADVPSRREAVRAIASSLQKRGRSPELVISSFDPAIVLGFARAAPRIPRAMLINHRTPRLATTLPRMMRRAAGIVAAHLEDATITKPRVARLLKSGLRVVAWTVNNPTRATALREMGVTTIITDHPAEIVATLTTPS